jgi:transcription elongation GreA/GreB family factor
MAWQTRRSDKIITEHIVQPIKKQLYELCQQYLLKRIQTAEEAIRSAQESANDETKNSAGDKYETGRAMMQLEIEQNTTQLTETLKLKRALDQLQYEKKPEKIQPGSLVITDQGNFFIAISVGQLSLEGKVYAVVSPESPVGKLMIGLQEKSSFKLGTKTFTIQQVL